MAGNNSLTLNIVAKVQDQLIGKLVLLPSEMTQF